MTERMTISEFAQHCSSGMSGTVDIHGYNLREGQNPPESYDDLVLFMTNRVGLVEIDEPTLGLEALHHWLMGNQGIPGSCSPDIDTEHVSSVILIGDLANRDEYVSMLPYDEGAIALPPTETVRTLINRQL